MGFIFSKNDVNIRASSLDIKESKLLTLIYMLLTAFSMPLYYFSKIRVYQNMHSNLGIL